MSSQVSDVQMRSDVQMQADEVCESQDVLQLLSGVFPDTPVGLVDDSEIVDLLSGQFDATQASQDGPRSLIQSGAVVESCVEMTVEVEETVEEVVEVEVVVEAEESDKESTVRDDENDVHVFIQQSKSIQDLIDESSDESEESEADEDEVIEEPLSNPDPSIPNPLRAILQWNNPMNPAVAAPSKPKNKFVDVEADVEEDEFMNYGGLDGEENGEKDEYDKSMLADDNNEPVNLQAIMDLHQYAYYLILDNKMQIVTKPKLTH